MAGCIAIWASLSFLLMCYFQVGMSCGKLMPFGNMTHDQDLEVGSNLTVQCQLFSNEIEVNHTRYTVSSENLLLKFKNTYLDGIQIVDDLTVEYSVGNATVDDSGSYSCYLTIPGRSSNLLVCLSHIAVGFPPLEVLNFSCISDDFRNLTCSWEAPFNPVKTDYTLYDVLKRFFRRKCPEVLNRTSCQYRKDTSPPYLLSPSSLAFLLVGNNSLGKIDQRIRIDHYKIVKPGMPRILPIFNATERSILLKWRPSKNLDYDSFPPGLNYSVRYYPELYPDDVQEVFLKFQENGSFLVNNLVPHTDYVFKIRCRSPDSEGENMWSPTAVGQAGTVADVPYLAPEITSSSFEMETTLGNRTITLYWKGVSPKFENGRNFHYIVEFHLFHVPSRVVREVTPINVGKKTFQNFTNLDAHSAYLFRISAVNEIGRSYNTSEIVVDKVEKLLDGPRDIVVLSHGNGTYNISWKMSNRRPMNYTLFWCQSMEPRPVKCNGALSWMHTLKQQVELELPSKSSYQFAVSANDGGKSSGMFWAPCIVALNVRYKVKRVELTPKNSTSMRIQWSLDCDAQRVVIEEYSIHYCKAQGTCCRSVDACPDWKIVHVKDASLEEYILGGLKPFTFYRAFVRAYTRTGWSEASNVANESTLSSAPSDPPRHVKVSDIEHKRIHLSFQPPLTPNGPITKYQILYNSTSEESLLEIPAVRGLDFYSVSIGKSIVYYSNYSIQVVACVGLACSPPSDPVYAFTGLSSPGPMDSPRVEVMQAFLNISWDPPQLPNGPIDLYQLWKESNDSERSEVFNVSSSLTHLALEQQCGKEDDQRAYFFRVRAANLDGGNPLFGEYSAPAKTMLCPSDPSYGLVIGITVGCAVGLMAMIFVIYSLTSCVRKEVATIKGTNVQLPKGLDSPMENPLSSYDKFKNGLQKNHDSGTPYDRAYERLCSFAAEGKGADSLIPNAKDTGNEYVAEEDSQRLKGRCNGRNNSGDSNNSGKCHDSISSSNTTKTHLSIDSGTEVDSPPSPDGFFSESSSSNTTPRSYKPDLAVVMENKGSNSRDSGLEKEGAIPKFAWYVKKKCDGRMPAYSKFAVMNPTMPSFMPYGDQNGGIKDTHSLSNSEPSVADFDMSNGSEPLILPGIQPYCKFGLARSAGNGLNTSNQPIAINSKVGYSKFGIVYRAFKCPEMDVNSPAKTITPSGSKFMAHNPKTMTALTFQNNPFALGLTSFRPAAFENPVWNVPPSEKKQIALKGNPVPPVEMSGHAYSKFGVSAPFANVHKPFNGYVSYQDTMNHVAPACEGNQQFDNAYSKVGVVRDSNEVEDGHDNCASASNQSTENGVLINAAALPLVSCSSHKPYVPFQSAMAMNHQNGQLWNGLDGKTCAGAPESKKDLDAEDSSSILQEIASDPLFCLDQTPSKNELRFVPEAAQLNVDDIKRVDGKCSEGSSEISIPHAVSDPVDHSICTSSSDTMLKSKETGSSDSSHQTIMSTSLDELVEPTAILECVQDSLCPDIAQCVLNNFKEPVAVESSKGSVGGESSQCDSQKLPDRTLFNDNHITQSKLLVPQKNIESHPSSPINLLKSSEDSRTSIRNKKTTSNGYVPLSELSKDSNLTSHISSRPNFSSLPVEMV